MGLLLKRAPVFVPRGYQEAGIALGVSQPKSGLLWQAGLGKTGATLCIYDELKRRGTVDKLYVIAPPTVAALVWAYAPSEFRNFEHLTTAYVHGPKKIQLLEADVDIYILSYSIMGFLMENKHLIGDRDMIVFDESTKLKNSQSGRFKILRKFVNRFNYRMILTGSFTTNGIEDLFGQMFALDSGETLGKYVTHFREAYMMPDPSGFGYVVRPGCRNRILTKIKPVVNQLSGDDILNLPGIVYKTVQLNLMPAPRKIYNDMRLKCIAQLELEESAKAAAIAAGTYVAKSVTAVAGSGAALTNKLLQIAGGGVYTSTHDDPDANLDIPPVRTTHFIHDIKTKAVKELVADLSGESAIIIYQTQRELDELTKLFPAAPVIRGLTPKKLKQISGEWNAGKHLVMIGHPDSLGHGLNLQHNPTGRSIIWYSLRYSLELWQQTNARLFRSEQKQVVFVYVLQMLRTLDVQVYNVVTNKHIEQVSVLEFLREE